MDLETVKQLGQGGFAMALLGLIYLVGMRLIKAIDRLGVTVDDIGKRVDEHTRIDVDHHNEVNEGLADLRARFDVLHDITPVEAPKRRARTAPRGVPAGYYAPHRPKTNGEDE